MFYMADTLINRNPDAETLYDIARLSADSVKFFNNDPIIAMLSHSNFGTDQEGSSVVVHEAVSRLQNDFPDMVIDGEMQLNFALNTALRDENYPFSKLSGKEANTLIFPNLSSANGCYQILQHFAEGTEIIGPIQMGLNKPIHFTDTESSVRDILNITAVAVIDAIVQKRKEQQ